MRALPYEDVAPVEWVEITRKLVSEHPLNSNEIVEVVLASWKVHLRFSVRDHWFSYRNSHISEAADHGFLASRVDSLGTAGALSKWMARG